MHEKKTFIIARRLRSRLKIVVRQSADSASDSLALFYSFNLPFLFLSSSPPPLLSLPRSRTLPPRPFITPLLHCRLKKAVLPLLPSFFLPPTFFPYRFSSSFSISPLDSRSRSPYLRSFSLSERAICPPGFFILRFHPSAVHEHTKRLSLIRCSPPSLHPFSLLLRCFRSPDYSCASSLLLSLSSKNLTSYLHRLNTSPIDNRRRIDGWRKKQRRGGGGGRRGQRRKIEKISVTLLVSLTF